MTRTRAALLTLWEMFWPLALSAAVAAGITAIIVHDLTLWVILAAVAVFLGFAMIAGFMRGYHQKLGIHSEWTREWL